MGFDCHQKRVERELILSKQSMKRITRRTPMTGGRVIIDQKLFSITVQKYLVLRHIVSASSTSNGDVAPGGSSLISVNVYCISSDLPSLSVTSTLTSMRLPVRVPTFLTVPTTFA